MSERMIGVHVTGSDSAAILEGIERAEELGIGAVWMTTGGAGLDALTLFSAAALRTRRILFGTSIVPTYPRHPIVMVQQVQVIAQLAPGRLRLGVGSSHRAPMTDGFGADFRAPLSHLSEYLHILKALLQGGSVDFDGQYLKAQASIGSPVDVPVMASALRPKSFDLCGAEADGAISWVCPGAYLRDVALPAMVAGAQRAGREVPPLIAHAPVCVHDDPAEARAAVREQAGVYPRVPFYQRMFAAAGHPESSEGAWSDAMIDATALVGNESQVTEKLEGMLSMGATEVLATPVTAGSDRAASLERTYRLLGQVSRSIKA